MTIQTGDRQNIEKDNTQLKKEYREEMIKIHLEKPTEYLSQLEQDAVVVGETKGIRKTIGVALVVVFEDEGKKFADEISWIEDANSLNQLLNGIRDRKNIDEFRQMIQ